MWINLTRIGMIGATMAVIMLAIGAIIQLTDEPDLYVKYDCRIAEISPDYPIEVKAKCRDILIKARRKNANH